MRARLRLAQQPHAVPAATYAATASLHVVKRAASRTAHAAPAQVFEYVTPRTVAFSTPAVMVENVSLALARDGPCRWKRHLAAPNTRHLHLLSPLRRLLHSYLCNTYTSDRARDASWCHLHSASACDRRRGTCTCATPSPVIEYVTPSSVSEYIAPAPPVTFATPRQQPPPAYTMAAATTGALTPPVLWTRDALLHWTSLPRLCTTESINNCSLPKR